VRALRIAAGLQDTRLVRQLGEAAEVVGDRFLAPDLGVRRDPVDVLGLEPRAGKSRDELERVCEERSEGIYD
jgi:hypothetical protein